LVSGVGGFNRNLRVCGIRYWQWNMGLGTVRWRVGVIEPLVGGNMLIALGVRMNCAVVQWSWYYEKDKMERWLSFGRIIGWMRYSWSSDW
jgi:hypothetical protein